MIRFEQPDASKHAKLSFVKSALRILAGVVLIVPQSLVLAGILFIVAEIVGIAEELV